MKVLLELFITFFKIGLFTFGGGYAMIAQIREIIVEKKQWINEEELMEIITIAESTPGPIAINMATYIGYKLKKIIGSVFATLGIIIPSFVIIFIISLFLEKFMEFKVIQYAFVGINVGVAFLIIKTSFNMVKKIEKKIIPISVFIIVFSLIILFDVLSIKFSSIIFILIGGLIGILYYSIINRKEGEVRWYI